MSTTPGSEHRHPTRSLGARIGMVAALIMGDDARVLSATPPPEPIAMPEAASTIAAWVLLLVCGCWAATVIDITVLRRGRAESPLRLGCLTLALTVPTALWAHAHPWVGAMVLLTIAVAALLIGTRRRPALQESPMPAAPDDSHLDPQDAPPQPAPAASGNELELDMMWPHVVFSIDRTDEATTIAWTDGPPAAEVARQWALHHRADTLQTRRSYTPQVSAQMLLDLADQGHWDLLTWPTAQLAAVGDRTWVTTPGDDACQMTVVAGETHNRPITYPLWRALLAVRPDAADRPEFADPVLEANLALAGAWALPFTVSLQIDDLPVLTISWSEGPEPHEVRELLEEAVPGVSVWTDRHTAQV